MPVHALKPVNDVELTRELLQKVLLDLSTRLLAAFGHQVRLIIHGGAVMVLHPELHHRHHTQDVDYIHRHFVAHYNALGVYDAAHRLHACIIAVAYAHGLGADWMNDHADVALPMATDPHGRRYDPISESTLRTGDMNVLFKAPGLQLLCVPWAWAFALKFVRYAKDDPRDIVAMLHVGERLQNVRWQRRVLEKWLTQLCWPMGYSAYQPPQLEELRRRMRDAIGRAAASRPQSQVAHASGRPPHGYLPLAPAPRAPSQPAHPPNVFSGAKAHPPSTLYPPLPPHRLPPPAFPQPTLVPPVIRPLGHHVPSPIIPRERPPTGSYYYHSSIHASHAPVVPRSRYDAAPAPWWQAEMPGPPVILR